MCLLLSCCCLQLLGSKTEMCVCVSVYTCLLVCILVYLPYAKGSLEQRYCYPFIRPAASVPASFPDVQSNLHHRQQVFFFKKTLLTLSWIQSCKSMLSTVSESHWIICLWFEKATVLNQSVQLLKESQILSFC